MLPRSKGNGFRDGITNCPHAQTRRLFMSGMCFGCFYQSPGKKNAWACEHRQTRHYSKGLCQSCYL
jgi:hypothetical protein